VHGRVELDGKPVTYFGIAYTQSVAAPFVNGAIGVRDPNGMFNVRIPPGHWDIVIAAPDAARREFLGIDVGASFDFGTLSLEHGHVVSGTVRDAAGAPLAGVSVAVGAIYGFDPPGELDGLIRGVIATRTDEDGRYTLRGLSRTLIGRHNTTIGATASDGRATVPVRVDPGTDSQVDLTVVATGGIEVIVDGGRTRFVTAATRTGWLLAQNIDGVYRFEHVPEGTYTIAADGPARASTTATVHAGAVETITLTLPALSPVAVDVFSTHGNCSVVELRSDDGSVVANTRCDGRHATFPSVAPGDYQACVDTLPCSWIDVDTRGPQQFDVPR